MIRYSETKETIGYLHYTVNCFYLGILEHHRMTNKLTKQVFHSHYSFKELEKIRYFKIVLKTVREQRYKVIYTDLTKKTQLFRKLREQSVTPVKQKEALEKQQNLKKFQNLQGTIELENVSLTANIVSILERYSSLIDLEKEYFPPEIITLANLSFFVK